MKPNEAAIAQGGVAAMAWAMSANFELFSSLRISRAAMARMATVTTVRATLELASRLTVSAAPVAQEGGRSLPGLARVETAAARARLALRALICASA